jgi:hypothetical protein
MSPASQGEGQLLKHPLSGINSQDRMPSFKTHSSGLYIEGRVYYRGPRNTPSEASAKLDLSASERVVRTPVFRKIVHVFPDDSSSRCIGGVPGALSSTAIDSLPGSREGEPKALNASLILPEKPGKRCIHLRGAVAYQKGEFFIGFWQ